MPGMILTGNDSQGLDVYLATGVTAWARRWRKARGGENTNNMRKRSRIQSDGIQQRWWSPLLFPSTMTKRSPFSENGGVGLQVVYRRSPFLSVRLSIQLEASCVNPPPLVCFIHPRFLSYVPSPVSSTRSLVRGVQRNTWATDAHGVFCKVAVENELGKMAEGESAGSCLARIAPGEEGEEVGY